MEQNVLMQIEYDGTMFSGWQRQPDQRTVQGTLESVIKDLLMVNLGIRSLDDEGDNKEVGKDRVSDQNLHTIKSTDEITLEGMSRTDAGVHAKAQYATLSADIPMPIENFKKALNDRLSGRPEKRSDNGDIRIVSIREIPKEFRIRPNVKSKKYVYSIWNAAEMPVFLRNYRYHVPVMLDLDRMREAAKYIVGRHDFACFQAAGGEPGETTVRTVTALEIKDRLYPNSDSAKLDCECEANEYGIAKDILIEITGDGFLYNMVRIIAGTLVEVGLGKREPEDMAKIIDSYDRKMAGHTAPPQGLCLEEAFFWQNVNRGRETDTRDMRLCRFRIAQMQAFFNHKSKRPALMKSQHLQIE